MFKTLSLTRGRECCETAELLGRGSGRWRSRKRRGPGGGRGSPGQRPRCVSLRSRWFRSGKESGLDSKGSTDRTERPLRNGDNSHTVSLVTDQRATHTQDSCGSKQKQTVHLRGVQCPTDIFPEDVSGQRVRGKMLDITNHQGFANPDHGEVSPRTCQNGCRQSADQQPEPVRTGTKGTLRTAAGTARRCGRRGRQAGGPSEGDAGTAGRPPGPPRGVCLKTPKARLRGDVRAPPCAAAAFQTPGCPPTGGWARDAAAPTAGFHSAVCRVDRPSGHRAK